jgi:predicted CopG family antitoxin
MAVKTITIDMEAYDRLASLKKEGQSFSQVIKELLPEKRSTGRDFLEVLERIDFSDDFVDAIDRIVADRRKSPARAPNLPS